MSDDLRRFVTGEVADFFKASYKTCLLTIALGTLSIVGGIVCLLAGSPFLRGLSAPLLLFGWPYLSISFQVINKIQPRQQHLERNIFEVEGLAADERDRVGKLHGKWARMHKFLQYVLLASVISLLVCVILKSDGAVFGASLGALVQSAVCITILLVSKFRVQLYQNALEKVSGLEK